MQTITHVDKEQLLTKGAEAFFAAIERAANENPKRVVVALPGGRSPGPLLEKLLEGPLRERFKTVAPKLQFFLVDERCVPTHHEDSNYLLLHQVFFSRALEDGLLKESQVNPFIYREGEEDYGASAYSARLAEYGGRFHVVLLGAGEDGHIAGLFPGVSYELPGEGYVAFKGSPKPPSERITVSAETLRKTDNALLLFLGEGKREAYEEFQAGRTPSALVRELPSYTVVTDLA